MALRVLGILGSPRRQGNSEVLLDQALAGAKEAGGQVEKLVLASLKMQPCLDCDKCLTTGICVLRDAMTDIYAKLQTLDRLILAAPVFFLSVPAQTKIIIDRCQGLWVTKYLLQQPVAKNETQRRGLFLSVAHSRRPTIFDAAIPVIKAWFATLDISYEHRLFGGIGKKGEVWEHPTACQDAFAAGAALVSN
ncbi:MAG: flavodoxin family protein [Chloroflexi bacterium]|nr:flavodoxin family protein [Chloroflexota bacterium]